MQLLFFLIARIWFAINLSQKSGTVKGKQLAINRQLDYNKDRTQIFVGTREAMLNETALEDPSGGHTAGRGRMYPTVIGGSGGGRFPEAEPVWPVDRPGADYCAGLHSAGNGI